MTISDPLDAANRLTRRTVLGTPVILSVPTVAISATPVASKLHPFLEIEKDTGGRLGVAVLDSSSGRLIGWRASERFPMCSTFKSLAVGLVLRRAKTGHEDLDRRVAINESDLVPGSPITSQHTAGKGMAVRDLCEAAITASDNTAGNLLLASFGGPAALTGFARALGDATTRLDRRETALNEARADDPRDTTSPGAMAHDLSRPPPRPHARRSGPVTAPRLGLWPARPVQKRIRAGLPSGWSSGDKTGTGENGTANDVAIVWPPNRKPLIIAVFLTGSLVGRRERSERGHRRPRRAPCLG